MQPARWVLAVGAALMFGASAACGQGFILAEGGGGVTGSPMAKEFFGWMVEHGGKGRALVLAARAGAEPDTDAEKVLRDLGMDDVRSLVITAAEADKPEIEELIRGSRFVWIRGGDQSRYVTMWKGTGVERGLKAVYAAGGAIGGTSAGCAVLGEWIYDARGGSCSPRDALRDGRTPTVTITGDFLGLTPRVLFDTHFTERARLARLPVMLAVASEQDRALPAEARTVFGVGMDTWTALAIRKGDTATVLGTGAATVVSATEKTVFEREAGKPPTITHLKLDQYLAGTRLTIGAAGITVASRPEGLHAVQATPGVLKAVAEPVVIHGSSPEDARAGAFVAAESADEHALFKGRMEIKPGEGRWPGGIVSTKTWESPAWDENRFGGVLLALAMNPGRIGLWLDEGAVARVEGTRVVILPPEGGAPPTSAMVLDARAVALVGLGSKVAARDGAPRQAVSLEGAVLHVLAPGWALDWSTGEVMRVGE